MRRRDQLQQYITLATVSICLLVLVGIWGIDAVCRLFSSADQVIYIIDDRPDSEMSTDIPEDPFRDTEDSDRSDPDSGDLKIRTAGIDIFGEYHVIQKTAESIHTGTLLQIDAVNPFTGNVNTLTGFENKNHYYRLKDMTLQVQSPVVEAMNEMAEAYYSFSGRADFLIYSTTEVYNTPGSLYPEFLPDRATGYCLDLAFLNDDGSISQITDSNNGWLVENAYQFGFVFSYTTINQSQSGISPAPYHLRYVGKEHAAVMHDNTMDLHTYLEALRSYPAEKSYFYEPMHLEIYYVPANSLGTTRISVDENKNYTISGNNTDGFIVCVSDTD